MSSKWLPNSLSDICTPAKVYIFISLVGLLLDRISPRPIQTQINPFNVLWGVIWFLILIRLCNEKCVSGKSISWFLVLLPIVLAFLIIFLYSMSPEMYNMVSSDNSQYYNKQAYYYEGLENEEDDEGLEEPTAPEPEDEDEDEGEGEGEGEGEDEEPFMSGAGAGAGAGSPLEGIEGFSF